MSNQVEMQKQLTAETNSTGLAEERYAVYQKSVEAAQARMTASWEELMTSGATSEMIARFYDASAGVLNFVSAIGGLKTVLAVATVALIAFYGVQIQGAAIALGTSIAKLAVSFALVAVQTNTATAAQWLLNYAMEANPVGVLIVAIGALAGVYYLLSNSIESSDEKLKRLNEELSVSNENFSKLKDKKKQIEDLKNEFDDLFGKIKPTKEESQKLVDVTQKLKELVPSLSGHFDTYGTFIADATTNMGELTSATDKQLEAEKKLNQMKSDASATFQSEQLLKKLYLKNASEENIKNKLHPNGYSEEQKLEIEIDWYKSLEETIAVFEKKSDEGKKAFIETMEDSTPAGKKLAEEIFIPMMKKAQEIVEENPVKPPPVTVEVKLLTDNEDYMKLVDQVVDMIKQQKNAEKDALQEQLKNIKDETDAQKDYYKFQLDEIKRVEDERKKAADRALEDAKNRLDAEKEAIKAQLEAYKSIIDKQKELLQLQKEESEYNADKADKEAALMEVETKIAELLLDTSEAGIAQRLELEAQAADMRKDIAKDEADRTYELQVQALDGEQERADGEAAIKLTELEQAQQQAELEHEMLMRQLEDQTYAAERSYEIYVAGLDNQYNAQKASLEAQIASIDEYLKQEGTMRNDAMDMIANKNSGLYQTLMDWNKKYGTGIDNDIIKMWDLAMIAVQDYNAAVAAASPIPASSSTSTSQPYDERGAAIAESNGGAVVDTSSAASDDSVWWNPFTWHDGIDKGFVGGSPKLKSNEEFAKLATGEAVLTPEQMDNIMRKTIPSMNGSPQTSSIGGGGMTVGNLMTINVAGGLDKSVIPSIENIANRVVDKINSSMNQRGFTRSANSFSI